MQEMAEAAKRKDDQLSDMMSRLDAKDKQMSDLIAQITMSKATQAVLAGTQIWRGFRTPVEMEGWGIPLSPRC